MYDEQADSGIDYPIIYAPSFIIMWGLALGLGLFSGGLLAFALVAGMLLVLIHHEHAHLKEIRKRDIKINFVKFNWLGGIISSDIIYANDAVPIYLAGVVNTGMYTGLTVICFAMITLMRHYNLILGVNFANNPYLNFLNSSLLFTSILLFSNIIPGSIKINGIGTIMTDGWAAYLYCELRDELWNDGKCMAIECGGENV